MYPDDVTVADYLKWHGNSQGGRVLRWVFAASYEERIAVLEEVLSQAYSNLVDIRGIIAKEDRGEDEISMQVVQMLNAAGISAIHDQHVNGHCDIVVDHDSGFRWLGEAKVHKNYGWLDDGFLQLSTRYGTALKGKDHGELIIYHRGGKSATVLKEWKKRLLSSHDIVSVTEDKVDSDLFFRTKHPCVNSGCNFFVRHTIVPLMHDPKK
ncbi:hypothetical protein [uncultured Aliiroseovarius sp.]|uniref:hypothetical protein n=1 Tax=uncultured Aliiroseovarius sp. TaxID=1658783 RepID=UPI002604FCF5|nr:hypothetical protein [uncultured Aliiroseovarius sp.]